MPSIRKHLQSLSGLHWLVVFLSLLLTLTAWQVSSRIAEQKALDQFEHEVEQLNELIRDRMRIYEFALISGAGAIRASGEDVNLDMWRRFSESLALEERLPGINGIGVIERVALDALPSYIEEKQQERNYFRVYPNHDRGDYWPIIYIEPEASNRAAVGLDMAHENNRYQAALKAMNTGNTQITGPITLVQDAEKTPGFLYYHPFYTTPATPPPERREAEFRGLVYAPFIMSRLMEGALANTNRMVHVRIMDGGTPLYSELDDETSRNFDTSPMFTESYDLAMYGRQWHFDVQTTRLFETFNASKQPLVILIGGIIIDAFILLVFALMASARRRAERRVEETTAELRESLEFISTLTDNLPMAVSVWDRNLTCRFMNAAGERWFNFSKETAIEKPLEQFVGPEVVAQRRAYYDRVLAGESVQASASFPDREGDIRDVVVSYYPVTLGGERCFMATTLDVTDLVQRERELQRLNEELEVQKREAESAVTVKTAFLANMSHEIRTPMNAIIGVLVLLQEAQLEEHPQRLVRKAYSAAEALLHLLNDILDLSKIEADRLELDLQPFEIDSLVRRSVDAFAIVAEEKGLNLRVAIDPQTPDRVVGDLLRISQVCTNLIGNALKFTREGSVAVRIVFSEKEGGSRGQLVIEVEDTGIGISPADQSRIFDNFRQADETTSRRFGGTGLGLSISLQLAELMGGSLTLDSTPGVGTTFRFAVPVEKAVGAAIMGSGDGDEPIHVLHHGFGHNMSLLEDYREHWGLELEPVADLVQWPQIMERIAASPDNATIFLVIDLEEAQTGTLKALIDALVASPLNYPVASVLLVVPAGCSADWILAFQRAGGRVTFEPLTPSRLYEHLSIRRRQKSEVTGAPRPRFKGVSVLSVDDVPLNGEIVESYLRSFGVEAHSVQTGDQALALLKERAFDLVLMDLHLEGETGQEVALRIQNETTVNKPVIAALSASIADADRMAAKESGMDDYLTKPVVPRDIRLLLETYFTAENPEAEVKPAGAAGQPDSPGLPEFIDPEAYQSLFAHDPELFLRCARSFVASAADMMVEAHSCTDLESITRLGHKIRGAAANIADTSLAEQARQVEMSEHEEAARPALLALTETVSDHARRLEQVTASERNEDTAAPAPETVRVAVERVRSVLSRNRIADDRDVEVIMGHLNGQGRADRAGRLRQALEAYEFEQALALLDDIGAGGNDQ